jgi:hypothetical protein
MAVNLSYESSVYLFFISDEISLTSDNLYAVPKRSVINVLSTTLMIVEKPMSSTAYRHKMIEGIK